MGVEELIIKIKVDDLDVKEAVSDETPIKEITETATGKSGNTDNIVDEAKYHMMFGGVILLLIISEPAFLIILLY